VSAEEAEQYLPSAFAAAGAATTRNAARDLVRRAAIVQGLIAGGMALTVALIHLAPVGARTIAPLPSPASVIVPDKPRGRVRVVANPWAEVWIDGVRAGETPLGNLSMTIGPHEVLFRHPEHGEQRHAVTVTLAAPARLSVDLRK